MRDKDSQLIFENYLNSKNDPIFEKWEDESSAWFWLKALDPTGLSSWPDVYDALVEVMRRPKDIGPWAMLILNIFLALPNFGILAFGVGAVGWQGARSLAKAAMRAGDKEAVKAAEKILNLAKDNKFLERYLEKFGKVIEQKGLGDKKTVDVYINMIKTGNISESIYKLLGGAKGEIAKDVVRGGKESFEGIKHSIESEQKPPTVKGKYPTSPFVPKQKTDTETKNKGRITPSSFRDI